MTNEEHSLNYSHNPSESIGIAVAGAAGRMGHYLCQTVIDNPNTELVGAFTVSEDPRLKTPAVSGTDVLLTSEVERPFDVLIDFSIPEALAGWLDVCKEFHATSVIGTTGLTEKHQSFIHQAKKVIPVIQATNFSRVVNVMKRLASQAAKMLGDAYDIELVEAHHKHKRDAPSGTALTLAQALCQATNRNPDKHLIFERHGNDALRNKQDITVQTLRLGDVVGEHTVMFATQGERFELKHIGTSRMSYAQGAVDAAVWGYQRQAGLYNMEDVLFGK